MTLRRAAALCALVLGSAMPLAAQVPMERVTLAQALERAVQLDPSYVAAVGRQDVAEWGRRAARLAFVLPALALQVDATKFSVPFFSVAINAQADVQTNASLRASYELFSLRKFADASAASSDLESAQAGVLGQRLLTALGTERDFYQVTSDRELLRVAEERESRARQQLVVGRARVLSGAAVQSDSLQLVLELVQARIASERQAVALAVSRAQLGRRIGAAGAVDADDSGVGAAEALPLALADAIATALAQGPQYRAARADERTAEARLRSSRSNYLPTITINAQNLRSDTRFFPSRRNVSQVQVVASLPIWNLGQREIGVAQARVDRDVARALRRDLERAAVRDVTEAYEGYEASRRVIGLADAGVAAARENYRVQDLRYRAGATTILDLLEAQFRLAQAESDAVQARFSARLALAGLEAILGRRFFTR